MVCLISYDLNVDNNNNQQVRDAICRLGVFTQCLESSWLVDTHMTCADVHEAIVQVLGPGDRFFVCPVKRSECVGRTLSSFQVWQWLSEHPE